MDPGRNVHDAPEGVIVNADVRVQKQNQVPMSVRAPILRARAGPWRSSKKPSARHHSCGTALESSVDIIHHQTLEWLGTGSREGVENCSSNLAELCTAMTTDNFRLVKHGSL